jgi:hypothetical protein
MNASDALLSETVLEVRQSLRTLRDARERSQGLQFTAMMLRECAQSARRDSAALRDEAARLQQDGRSAAAASPRLLLVPSV